MEKKDKVDLTGINNEDENLTELSEEEKENLNKKSVLKLKREREKNNMNEKKENKNKHQNNNLKTINKELCSFCKNYMNCNIFSNKELINYFFDKFKLNEYKSIVYPNIEKFNKGNFKISICENCLLKEILLNGFNKLFDNNINDNFSFKERKLMIEKIETINEILEKNINKFEETMNKTGLKIMFSKNKDQFQNFNEFINSFLEIFNNEKNEIKKIINDLKDQNINFQKKKKKNLKNLNKNNLTKFLYSDKKINNNEKNNIFKNNNIINLEKNKNNLLVSNQDSISFSSKSNNQLKNYLIGSFFPIHEVKSDNYGTFKETPINKINLDESKINKKGSLLSNFNINFNNKQNDLEKEFEFLTQNLNNNNNDKNDFSFSNLNNEQLKENKKNFYNNNNLEIQGTELDFSKINENSDYNNNDINQFSLGKNLDSLLFNNKSSILNEENAYFNIKNMLQYNDNLECFNKNLLLNNNTNNKLFDKLDNYNLFLPPLLNEPNLNFLDNPLLSNLNNHFLQFPSLNFNDDSLKQKLNQGIIYMYNEYINAHNIKHDNYPQRKNIKIEDLFIFQ